MPRMALGAAMRIDKDKPLHFGDDTEHRRAQDFQRLPFIGHIASSVRSHKSGTTP